ncbi:hypothetical protein WPS_18260 [Vulcanimicrobium alpinum]|uniref:Uncharacterized protein n=1 Tax=Vulcanimicrobium alpinum TaxID=3016050 RepID=A0AAN1XX35_UNVUL|nr:hypothetical protein [Vulcanimicrobium alpinum]BDE06550.1 hypothetical protein WPS_18260 [Vulcanimicrobium alpinum]
MQDEHGFTLARVKVHDALRAVHVVAVTERGRLRDALRATLCASAADAARFDAAFDAFFAGLEGVAQPAHPLRRTMRRADATGRGIAELLPKPAASRDSGDGESAARWDALRARYSAAEGTANPRRSNRPRRTR